MVFDVDDALWVVQRRFHGSDRIAARSQLIIAGNQFLADRYSTFAETVVIPTAVDVSKYRQGSRSGDRKIVGWVGTSSGFQYLSLIETAIGTVLRSRPNVDFVVMADRPPPLSLPSERVKFLQWTPDGEVEFLESMTVGLMPLRSGDWERGKCSYKMLSYMASGVPVVVSPVGMNIDVLAEGEVGFGADGPAEWVERMITLLDDEVLSARLGDTGRKLASELYSVEPIADRIARALRSLTT